MNLICITTGDWIQIVILFITAIGIFVAIRANKNQLVTFNKQLKLNFFADYTKRYQEIILNFPENINDKDFDLNNLDKELRDKSLRYMRAYFDLCSEEYHLNKKNHIDKEVWIMWEGGIRFALSKKAFQDSWNIIRKDTQYSNDFKDFVEKEIKKCQ